jgi:hypothetical protein
VVMVVMVVMVVVNMGVCSEYTVARPSSHCVTDGLDTSLFTLHMRAHVQHPSFAA